MQYNKLVVGKRVKVKLHDQSIRAVDFYGRNDGSSGTVVELDDEDSNLNVYVELDNGSYDWGHNLSLVAENESDNDDTISDKLAEIEKLVKEIRDML